MLVTLKTAVPFVFAVKKTNIFAPPDIFLKTAECATENPKRAAEGRRVI
jgi:hypothetical protein